MMRLVAALAALAAIAIAAMPAVARSGSGVARASSRAAHTWQLDLGPSNGSWALAQIRFRARRGARISQRTLSASVPGPFGSDYLVAAGLRAPSSGRLVALVLLVNRPSALAHPAPVRLRVRSAGALGAHTQFVTSETIHPIGPGYGANCRLTNINTPLTAASLRMVTSRGEPLAGFTSPGAVAAAYDQMCEHQDPEEPTAHQFERDVEPNPPGSEPTPTPTPPRPPGCSPCEPRPGFACPLSATPSICYARPARRPAETAGTSAH
jgi:hypothetical protein